MEMGVCVSGGGVSSKSRSNLALSLPKFQGPKNLKLSKKVKMVGFKLVTLKSVTDALSYCTVL